jgi:replicative superfamily II helicase
MDIFKRKLKETNSSEKPIDPIDLYPTLFHEEGYEYLRGVQSEVLSEWHETREKRDLICKMNTGAGKTLVGLLMLYSKLMEGIEHAVYVCPDNQLVNQTIEQANNYGIPVCTFGPDGDFPHEFMNNEEVLVCTFDKLFNGMSIFGVEGESKHFVSIGAIVVDDAHTCVNRAKSNSTIKVSSEHELYKRLLRLFSDSLKSEATGTYRDLIKKKPGTYMRVPYWSWLDNHNNIIDIIAEYTDENDIKFPWGLIKDNLLQCNCFFSSNHLEIVPMNVPYYQIPAFNEANHRYFLSATFEDDTDLLKNLGVNKESILNPIVPKDRKDIGERLILTPNRYDSSLTDNKMRKLIAKAEGKFNVVVIVPSRYHAQIWTDLGAEKVDKHNINDAKEKLKNSSDNFMVFINRYDGVDLPGDMCRMLILDGKPGYYNISDRYFASTRIHSTILDAKLAQVIEQGLGRGVRSGSDYCVVFILDTELVKYLGYNKM